ncbi:MAG: TetR/AcrR family transcriptional regulator [Corynebacterium nuruki]|jgi:AcrR family transcriptional regulator|nr:TetR/AcrR family transcriptional regulator [Corynebacterium nuruki]
MEKQRRRAGRPSRTSLAELVEAATALGLKDFTLGGVAARAGIAEATVYNYVSGRDDLYRKACDRLIGTLPLDSDATTWTGFIDDVSARAVDLAAAHPGLAPYLFYGPYEPEAVRVYTAMVDRVRALRPGTTPNQAYLLASRPFLGSLYFAAAPKFARADGWLRRAMMHGMERRLAAGDLPDIDPALEGDWTTLLRTPEQ